MRASSAAIQSPLTRFCGSDHDPLFTVPLESNSLRCKDLGFALVNWGPGANWTKHHRLGQTLKSWLPLHVCVLGSLRLLSLT